MVETSLMGIMVDQVIDRGKKNSFTLVLVDVAFKNKYIGATIPWDLSGREAGTSQQCRTRPTQVRCQQLEPSK